MKPILLLFLSLTIFFILPSKDIQYQASVSFLLANTIMFCFGSFTIAFFLQSDENSKNIPLFTRIWLGQIFTLIFLFPLMLLNEALYLSTGKSIPMPWLIYSFFFIALSIFIYKIRNNISMGFQDFFKINPSYLIYLLVASIIIAPILAIYSNHLSALGLDMHQHIYWGLHVYEMGFIPLNERFTNILSEYPKGFHYLTSIWSALGLNALMYSIFVKMMPFYQALLFCLVLLELVSIKFVSLFKSSKIISYLFLTGGLLLTFYVFFIVKIPYPVWDLLGTGRFSASSLMMTPLLFFYLGYFLKNKKIISYSIILFPIVCSILLTFNPVLLFLELTFVLPILLLHLFTLGKNIISKDYIKPSKLLISILFSALYLSLDPWIVSKLPILSSFVENVFGYYSLQKANYLNLASEREFLIKPVHGELCFSLRCLVSNLLFSIEETIKYGVTNMPVWFKEEYFKFLLFLRSPGEVNNLFSNFIPFRVLSHYPYIYSIPFIFFFPASVFIFLTVVSFKKEPKFLKKFLSVFLIVWGGVYCGGIFTLLFIKFIEQFDIHKSRLIDLLVSYLSLSGGYLGSTYVWLLILIPTSYGIYQYFKLKGPNFFYFGKNNIQDNFLLIPLFLTIVVVSYFGVKIQKEIHHSGAEDSIYSQEVKAVYELNSLSLNGNVVIPAYHNKIGIENWLLPDGPVTTVLPFIKVPTIFHLGLGKGILYSWRNYVENFCSEDKNIREAFIRNAQINYLLVRKPNLNPKNVLEKTKICQKYFLKDFGIKEEPVFNKNGIMLFAFESFQ